MNCFQAKANQIAPQWYVIDAADVVVGRLASQIAPMLMGKHRPTYTPHIDTGDYIIVTNVEKVVFTGDKWRQKSYQRYSGHPGGQKEEAAWKLLQRRPEQILKLAITRMMPKNKIGRHMMAKLMLYVGPKHPHQAQQPIPLAPTKGDRPAAAGIILIPPAKPRAIKPKVDKKAPALTSAPAVEPVATATIEPAAEVVAAAPAVEPITAIAEPTVPEAKPTTVATTDEPTPGAPPTQA